MNSKVCFLFGHSTAPQEVIGSVEAAAERHYLEYGISEFVVGNRGSFDRCAALAIKRLKRRYGDVFGILLLAYHPAERALELPQGFDSSYYPPLENVPRRYAIVRANKYMINRADSVICYVKHFGNTRNLLEYAQRRQKKEGLPIENVAEDT